MSDAERSLSTPPLLRLLVRRVRHQLWVGLRGIATWPFVEPKMALPYGTAAGLLLGIGTNLVMRVISENTWQGWRLLQTIGSLLSVAALSLYAVAWSIQSFGDSLVRDGKSHAGTREKTARFRVWSGRWTARTAASTGLVALAVALALLRRFYTHSQAMP